MEFNRYHSPFGHEELMAKCRKIKHVALDMDGTIYLGSKLFPFTLGFLKDLEDMGINTLSLQIIRRRALPIIF